MDDYEYALMLIQIWASAGTDTSDDKWQDLAAFLKEKLQ